EETPAPVTPVAPPPAPVPTPAQTAAEAAPPPPSDSNPTVLSEADLARDKALVPQAAAIVDAYSNWGSAFLSLLAQVWKDKKRVLYGSTRDGVPEIFLGEVAKPGEPPRAITKGPERAIFATFTRDEKHILYTRDEGADEAWRFYLAAPDGSNPTLI